MPCPNRWRDLAIFAHTICAKSHSETTTIILIDLPRRKPSTPFVGALQDQIGPLNTHSSNIDISLSFPLGNRHLAQWFLYTWYVSMQKIVAPTVCHDDRMILPLKFGVRLGHWEQLTVPRRRRKIRLFWGGGSKQKGDRVHKLVSFRILPIQFQKTFVALSKQFCQCDLKLNCLQSLETF